MGYLSTVKSAMTSLEISEIIGVRHTDLIRSIRSMEESWVKAGQPNFSISSYTDQWNRSQPQYVLSKKECLYVATKFNDEARARLIIRWDELENMHQLPQTFSEALMLAAKQAQELENKDRMLQEQKPKVLFAEAVETSKTSILISELAKILNQNGIPIGQNRLFEWLRSNGYLIQRKGTDYNIPTQRAMELGLFEIKETAISRSNGNITLSKTPKVTGKGQTYFVNKFINGAIHNLTSSL